MPDVVRPCVLPKGGDVMPRPTLSDRVCCLRAVMACHARRSRPSVLFKGDDVMPRPTLVTVCAIQEGYVIPSLTSSDCACSPRAVM